MGGEVNSIMISFKNFCKYHGGLPPPEHNNNFKKYKKR
jgi:hypothetical protein